MAAKKSPLREALAKRRVKEDIYRIPITDDTAARERVEEAKQKLLFTGIGKANDDPDKLQAREELAAAQAELDACFHLLRLRAVPRADYEALVAAHPPTDPNSEKPWDKDTLLPALVAACAVDSELTEEEWAAELDSWSAGEQASLFKLAVNVNIKPVNDGLGKD